MKKALLILTGRHAVEAMVPESCTLPRYVKYDGHLCHYIGIGVYGPLSKGLEVYFEYETPDATLVSDLGKLPEEYFISGSDLLKRLGRD